MALTATQASLVLQHLLDQNRISRNEIRQILDTQTEIKRIEERLAQLRGLTSARPRRQRKRVSSNARKRSIARSGRKISRNGRASYQLQGQYIGYLRQIPKAQRARFQRIAKGEGRERAIQLMREHLGK